jgi:hypothetical protein
LIASMSSTGDSHETPARWPDQGTPRAIPHRIGFDVEVRIILAPSS